MKDINHYIKLINYAFNKSRAKQEWDKRVENHKSPKKAK